MEVSQARQGRERLRWVARSTTERSGVIRGQPPESPSSWTPIVSQPQANNKPLLHGFGRKLARDPQFRKVIFFCKLRLKNCNKENSDSICQMSDTLHFLWSDEESEHCQ